MEDTGQALDAESQRSKRLWNAHLASQLTAEHFMCWAAQVAATAAVRPLGGLSMATILAAMQICVCGLAEDISEHELAAFFSELMSANAAAVAPGAAVTSCQLLPDHPGTALLELRCSVEASNCLAFDGVQFKGSTLQVQRPKEYCPEDAVLLGPCQPDPAVHAVIERSSHAAHAVAGQQQQQQLAGAAVSELPSSFTSSFASIARRPSISTGSGAAAAAGAATSSHAASSCSFAAAVKCGGAATACTHPTCSRVAAMAPAAVASAGASASAAHVNSSCGTAGGMPVSGSSTTCRAASRDLLPAADQSNKQDEVFIGGLPSHWKAMQVKELLAPYGQLKSLSVAMDAATGKNKGYAFVVFASPVIVSRAIEELDCKVVDGKILAVQRATDGKAACGSSSGGARDVSSSGAGAANSSRDAGGSIGGGTSSHEQQPQLLQQHQQAHQQHYQHRQPHRSSSGSSSSGGGGFTGSAAGAAGSFGCSPGSDSLLAQHTQHVQHAQQLHVPGPMSQQAAAALAAAAGEGGTLGQRLLAAVYGGGGAAAAAGPGGLKQYDVNELYIGDLPLSWDEDAVRRLLGRYGKIKYFTLRNGRDKNFAFCKFKDSSVVDAAIQGLHGKIVDGYFLNVRRAIEGKQQQQQQQQWPGKQGSSSSNGGAAAAGRGLYHDGTRPALLRPADPQQQQQQQKFAAKGSGYGRVPAAAAAAAAGAAAGETYMSVPASAPPAVTAAVAPGVQCGAAKVSQPGTEWAQQQEQQQIKAVATPAGTPAAAGAKAGAGAATSGTPAAAASSRQAQQAPEQQQRQQDDISTAFNAPSPPETPRAAPVVPQPALQPAAAAAEPREHHQQQPLRVPNYTQNLPFQPNFQQQQQQQALQQPQPQQHQMPSLFMNTGQPSWGTAGDVMGSYQLFSPWSLFSSAQKSQW